MLVIGAAQLEVLDRNSRAPVREKFAKILREHLPRHAGRLSDETLDTICERGILAARSYGIDVEVDVYVVVASLVVLGSKFDSSPEIVWRNRVMADPKIDQHVKAQLLRLRIFVDCDTDIGPNGR